MIDLDQRHLEKVKEILAQLVPDIEVKAFGSRVVGGAKQYSDLDLVLMTDTPLPPIDRAHLEDAFEESDLPIRIDLVEWATLSEDFRSIITKSCELL
jgi:uncharacterized protein